jgi:hypothetical protein
MPVKPATSTKPARKIARPIRLGDALSASVIAEYLAITEDEILNDDALVVSSGRYLSPRHIAMTFLVSDILGVRDAFELAPRFQSVFASLRGDAPSQAPA